MHAAAGVNVICAPAPTDLDKAAPLKRSRSMKETLEKEFPVLDEARYSPNGDRKASIPLQRLKNVRSMTSNTLSRSRVSVVIQDGKKYVFELTKCVVQIASYKPIGSRLSTPSI